MKTHYRMIRRVSLIIERIRNGTYPSFKKIEEYLIEHDIETTSRTISRDIKSLKEEFGVEVIYDKINKGYFIDEEMSQNVNELVKMFDLINSAGVINQSLYMDRQSLRYIDIEEKNLLKGIHFLENLIFSIMNNRKVEITHQGYDKSIIRPYELKPYMLKEYNNRWYVVAIDTSTDQLKKFAVDRMIRVDVSENTFEKDPQISPHQLFEDIIGIQKPNNPIEEVIIQIDYPDAHYIMSLPLHKSQKIIEQNEENITIGLNIILNFELEEKIIALRDKAIVLKPEHLAERIKNIHLNSYSKYKNQDAE